MLRGRLLHGLQLDGAEPDGGAALAAVRQADESGQLAARNTVLRYTAAEACWYTLGNLVHPRAQHTVVGVPEDWLCHGTFTTTTTTTTTTSTGTASTAEVTTTPAVTSASPPPDCQEDVRCEVRFLERGGWGLGPPQPRGRGRGRLVLRL